MPIAEGAPRFEPNRTEASAPRPGRGANGLAGRAREIQLLHFAIGGLIAHLLTLPAALGPLDVEDTVATLVDRIVFHPPAAR